MVYTYPNGPSPIKGAGTLEPFVAELVAPTLHRLSSEIVNVRASECTFSPHPDLGEVEAWGYGLQGGPVTTPGVGLEAVANQPTHIRFSNELAKAELPFDVVVVPHGDGADGPQNYPGTDGVEPEVPTGAPIGWLVPHLHGAHTDPESDGWTDEMRPPGRDHLYRFRNDDDNADLGLGKVGPALWYHDHAMNATRLHVYAGLAAPYLIRHPREAELGLPTSRAEGEAVLFIQDRNFHVTAEGSLRLLHKTTTRTAEFFGPYTMVNGVLWPRMRVAGDIVRLRIYSGSNARYFRLHLVDEDGNSMQDRIVVIGTDGGLLWKGHQLAGDDSLTLAAAERMDILVDLRGLVDRRLVLVNSADAPFSGVGLDETGSRVGQERPEVRLPYPQVMCFDIVERDPGSDDPDLLGWNSSSGGDLWDSVAAGAELNPDHRRLTLSASGSGAGRVPELEIPADATHRLVLLSENEAGGMLLQTEVERDDDGDIEIQLPGEDAPRRYRAVAADFYETITIMPVWREWEVWHFLNTTGDTHPMHIHQSFHQPLGARAVAYRAEDRYDQKTRRTIAPIVPDPEASARAYQLHETNGWKDTTRVDPNSMVSVAIRFDLVGRFVYHCHMIEHEDSAMMRPFVVTPVKMEMMM